MFFLSFLLFKCFNSIIIHRLILNITIWLTKNFAYRHFNIFYFIYNVCTPVMHTLSVRRYCRNSALTRPAQQPILGWVDSVLMTDLLFAPFRNTASNAMTDSGRRSGRARRAERNGVNGTSHYEPRRSAAACGVAWVWQQVFLLQCFLNSSLQTIKHNNNCNNHL